VLAYRSPARATTAAPSSATCRRPVAFGLRHAEVAGEIAARLRDANPLVLAVMGGAVVFTGALLPQLDFPLDFDYLHVTRYGDVTTGGGCTGWSSRVPRWPGAACWWSTTSSTRA
jgi:hypothetical protein